MTPIQELAELQKLASDLQSKISRLEREIKAPKIMVGLGPFMFPVEELPTSKDMRDVLADILHLLVQQGYLHVSWIPHDFGRRASPIYEWLVKLAGKEYLCQMIQEGEAVLFLDNNKSDTVCLNTEVWSSKNLTAYPPTNG